MGKFFEYHQNNSGGSFHIDDERGIGPLVWIEANDASHADHIAISLGIYFDGADGGQDCECYGDRWYPASKDGEDKVEPDAKYDFEWHDTAYVHRADGTIDRLKKPGT